MDSGTGRVWGQPWQVDGAGAGGSSPAGQVGSRKRGVPMAEAMPVRAEPHLEHLKKDPGPPGRWAGLGRVRRVLRTGILFWGGCVYGRVSPGRSGNRVL